jgi:putative ABC transport system permease protein
MTRRHASSTAPPRLAERLLARALPGRIVDACLLGDLAEEHHAMAAARGPRVARRWYWRQALALAARAISERRLGALASPRAPGPGPHGDTMMEALWRDLRLAMRALLRQPAFALTAFVTLAVGLAANAAIFAMLDAIVLRPLTFRDVDRLVQVFGSAPTKGAFSDRSHLSPADFHDMREQTRAAETLAAAQWWDATVTATREPERIQGFRVSPVFFSMFGIDLAQGRAFLQEEGQPGRNRVAVLGHALWTRKYASDPAIVGRTVSLDGEPYTVIGIAPERFQFPMGAEVWTPLAFTPEQLRARERRFVRVMGKLAEGRTVADLQAELGTFARRLADEYPDSNRGWSVNVMSLNQAVQGIGNAPLLATWQVSAMLLLLIACVNVSCLLLVRGSARHKELALRAALGAGRWRIVRQLLIENLALSLAGVVLALPLASATIRLTKSMMPAQIARFIPGWERLGIDLRLIVAMAACAVCATLVFGLLPALRASRVTLTDSLKEGGRSGGSGGRQRLRSALVLVEIALALTLLVAAGLSVRSTMAILARSDGYDPEGVMTMRVTLPETKYGERLQRRQFFEQLAERGATQPGIEQAALVNFLPSGSDNFSVTIEIDGRPVSQPSERRTPDYRVMTPNYLETMRIRLLSGRAFDARDRDGAMRVAIVSRTMADRYWSGEDPVGRRFRINRETDWVTIVGVVDDVRHTWFMNYLEPTLYVPLAQGSPGSMALVLRGAADASSLARAGRAAVLSLDGDQPVYDVSTMNQVRSQDMLGLRYAAGFMGGFGLVALVLAAVGVYGVMAYAVSERTHEIGVRIALGASRRHVLVSTIGHSLLVTGIGLVIGLVAAYALGRFMESALFGSVRMDLLSFILFPSLLAAAALVASSVPARRAMRVDPIIALRGE